MAEVKQNFIKSRMNQDLESRLVSQGEYREGRNINVSKSEGDDVGELENIIGNSLLTTFNLEEGYECIGQISDSSNDRLYLFFTNYSDNSPTTLQNPLPFNASPCYIYEYNIQTSDFSILVGGQFLNLSKNSPIIGINIIEDLLFWTDNRNQPRKINITSARAQPYTDVNPYYYNEDQISVAKYYPYNSILLLDKLFSGDYYNSSMTDVVSERLPIHLAARVVSRPSPTQIIIQGPHIGGGIASGANIVLDNVGTKGDLITGRKIDGKFVNVTVAGVAPSGTDTLINLNPAVPIPVGDLEADDIIYFQRLNPYYDKNWPGDPDWLAERFVRFSYRFEYDDGEYSLIAPFTQIAFVPKQDGYFIGTNAEQDNPNVGQEAETYASSVVQFMENKINNINLFIPKPTDFDGDIDWNEVKSKLHVKAIDILIEEADTTAVKVVETLNIDTLSLGYGNELVYNYQSQKPWKTLPASETTRVWDKVPVRAFSQESSGNRIIYGNYVNKHTSPEFLNYTLRISEKPPIPLGPGTFGYGTEQYYVRKEYQNHTIKQNRTYQVGVVLSDRYGRRSDVTLNKPISSEEVVIDNKNSTIYHPYRNSEATLITDSTAAIDPSNTWPGDQLSIIFNQLIPDTDSRPGYPGLYNAGNGEVIGFTNFTSSCDWPPNLTDCQIDLAGKGTDASNTATLTFSTDINGCIDPTSLVITGSGSGYFNGEEVSFTIVGPPYLYPTCLPTSASIGTASLKVVTAARNPLGWYSYNIVVKQTEQEYYNVYLPGILAGYPLPQDGLAAGDNPTALPIPELVFPTGEGNRVAHIVLLNDNINKVPRDLNEVGPVQKEFRSSVRLFGRVENVKVDFSGSTALAHINQQYSPGIFGDTVTVIGTMSDLKLGDLQTNPVAPWLTQNNNIYDLYNFFNPLSDPLIARLSTEKEIGQGAYSMDPFLAVYETEPTESLLDIYWESTTSGLIKQLNKDILEDEADLPVGISDPALSIEENMAPLTMLGVPFTAVNQSNTPLGLAVTISLVNIVDLNFSPRNELELIDLGGGQYQFRVKANNFFIAWADQNKNTLKATLNLTAINGSVLPYEISIPINNIVPYQRGYWNASKLKEDVFLNNMWLTTQDSPKACVPISYPGAPLNCDPNKISVPYGDTGCPPLIADAGAQSGGPGYGVVGYPQCYAAGNTSKEQYAPGSWILPNPTAPGIYGEDRFVRDYAFSAGSIGNWENSGIIGTRKWAVRGFQKECGWWDSSTACSRPFPPPVDFNGVFEVGNGGYGTIPTQVPPGPDTWQDVKWEVVRMYQVSVYTQHAGNDGEIIFGDNSAAQGPQGGPSGASWPMVASSTTCARWRSFGLPDGPIYWENNALLQEEASANPSGNCEEYVGERYQPASPFGGALQYWQDIEWLRAYGYLEGVAGNPGLMAGGAASGVAGNVPIKIADDMYGKTSCWSEFNSSTDGGDDSFNATSGQVYPNPADMSQWFQYVHNHNTNGNGWWTTSYPLTPDPQGIYNTQILGGNPLAGIFKASPYSTGLTNPPMTNPQSSKCVLAADRKTPYQGAVWTPKLTTPGRYVVTLRATDMGGNGLYTEYDLPIIVFPAYAYDTGLCDCPTNIYGQCDCC